MVEVGRHGALAVNRTGLGGAPFPLSFSAREASGSWTVDATAAQAAELADVLMGAANDTIVMVGLATNSFLDEDYVQWRPSRIAAEQGVSCQVHFLGAPASGVGGLSEEALVMRREDPPRFLAGWSAYELTLVDMPGRPTPERLDEIALTIGTAPYGGPVLPGLAGSRLRYSGHDDCYLAVESTDQTVPVALFSLQSPAVRAYNPHRGRRRCGSQSRWSFTDVASSAPMTCGSSSRMRVSGAPG